MAGSLLDTLRRRSGLVLLPAVLAGAVALTLSTLSTDMYRASAQVLVDTDARSITSEAAVASNSATVEQVREVVGGEPDLQVEALDDSEVLVFTATSSNAENAATAANVHAAVYVAERADGAQVIEAATVPSDPFEPETVRNTILAFAVGLLIGLVAAVVVSRLDTTIRSPRRLAAITGVPNLAIIPRVPLGDRRPDDLAALGDPNSTEAEAYRTLRTAVEFLLNESGARVVLVTSPRPGEGKSSVAANLAVTAAQAGRNVVLIDGDLRKPQMHRSFGLRNDRGLSTVLAGDSTLGGAVKRTEAAPNLVVLPAGPPPPDPADLLVSDRLAKSINGLSQAADLVVIDAPPVLPVTDSTILVQQCDAVLLAATAGLSDRREWQETLDRLAVVRANVIGTVMSRPDSHVDATPTYLYAPTAAPAGWWVAQSGRSSSATKAETSDVTSVMTKHSVDDLVWDRTDGTAAATEQSGSSVGTTPDGSAADSLRGDVVGSNGSSNDEHGERDGEASGDGDGDERGSDRGLQSAGPSNGDGRGTTDESDREPPDGPHGGTLPPPHAQLD